MPSEQTLLTLYTVAFLLASAGFLVLAALVLVRPIRSVMGRAFLICSLVSSVVLTVVGFTPLFPQILLKLRALGSLPLVAWSVFLIFWLKRLGGTRVAFGLGAVLLGAWVIESVAMLYLVKLTPSAYYTLRVIIALVAIISAEQVVRNAPDSMRWSVKHLALAVAACAGFEVVYFGSAIVTGRPSDALSITRGVLWALSVPLFAISAARNPSWELPIHISRNVVFHTLTMVIVGSFLVAIAVLGYLVSTLGVAWSDVLQFTIAAGAALFLATLLMSQSVRARIRGFADRNFYNYRYDYRKEWLGFTQALTHGDAKSVYQTIGQAYRALIDSPGVAVYAHTQSGDFTLRYTEGMGKPADVLQKDEWSQQTPYLLDLSPASENAANKFIHAVADAAPARVAVPLVGPNGTHGFVLLAAPRAEHDMDREVLNLLAVASKQAGSLLLQFEATEELLVARQFDAFNKMSAFVVHDLKNLAAQLSLLTANAEYHRDNPEFQADMLDTVRHVTGRMKLLLEQLANGATANPAELVNVVDCVRQAIASKPGLKVKPTLYVDAAAPALALAHTDRLSRIFGHLVQNADEALRDHDAPTIDIEITDHSEKIVVVVCDNGPGMSDTFIREKLFRPFVSTKHTGMGIGVFESANYLKEIDGSIVVTSRIGEGTRFEVSLGRMQPG